MLYLNHEEIVKLRTQDLQQEAERFRSTQHVRMGTKEWSTLYLKAKDRTLLNRLFSIGRRML